MVGRFWECLGGQDTRQAAVLSEIHGRGEISNGKGGKSHIFQVQSHKIEGNAVKLKQEHAKWWLDGNERGGEKTKRKRWKTVRCGYMRKKWGIDSWKKGKGWIEERSFKKVKKWREFTKFSSLCSYFPAPSLWGEIQSHKSIKNEYLEGKSVFTS